MRDKDRANANENVVSEGEGAGSGAPRLSFPSRGLALSSSCDVLRGWRRSLAALVKSGI